MTKAVLCDIEGTTTSLSFAHDVLCPLSRKEMPAFVRDHWNDPALRPIFDRLGKQSPEEVIEQLQSWIDADKKEGTLKEIQGKIWRKSFEEGAIRAHVYPDVPRKWKEWKARRIRIYIFSSGSVEAQKLLFRYSEAGDLTPLLDGYFDTTMGPKKEAESYIKIAKTTGLKPVEILFLSDVSAELDAAREAGMQTTHILRENEHTETTHPSASTFETL